MSASEPVQLDAPSPLDQTDPAADLAALERALAVGPPDVPPAAGIRTTMLLLSVFAIVIIVSLSGRPIVTHGERAPISRAHLIEPLPDLRIDPNAATEAELMLLPAIGPVLARNIIESREIDGPFLIAEDLDRVHRIGPKTIEKLRPFITLPAADPAPSPSPVTPPPSLPTDG